MATTFTTTPAVPVLQSDTFEIQRQKINNLATDMTTVLTAGPGILAYVQFIGNATSVTIKGSYNVSSVTRQSLGIYTINFTTPTIDNQYMVIGCGTQNSPTDGNVSVYEYWTSQSAGPAIKTTSAVQIVTLDTDIGGRAVFDAIVSLVIIGNRG